MPKTIAFRVDGNSRMGTGHLARCRVLAEACLKRGWRVIWMSSSAEGRKFAPSFRKVKVVSVARGLNTRLHARAIGRALRAGDVVVLDGYHFGRGLETELRRAGLKVATIDDNARRAFASNVVLNGNVHARSLRYRRAAGTRLALGSNFFILSEEVRTARKRRAVREPVRRILVTMGGADPSNQAMKVLKAIELAELKGVSVLLIAGAVNPKFSQLRRFAARCPFHCRVIRTTPRLGREMTRADLGIGSAGRIATEMAYLGLPGLRLVLADNQRGLIRVLHRSGAALNLGWYARLTPRLIASELWRLIGDVALRRKMSDKGRRMLDGKGTQRTVKILASL